MAGPLRRAQDQGVEAAGPALGLIEVRSIARGLVVADAMVKRAAVHLALVRPVSPGKHLCLCTGGVAEVEEAMSAGRAAAEGVLCDEMLLHDAHQDLLRALAARASPPLGGALGVVETLSAAAALLSADRALKAAEVGLQELRLCDGLGGKAFYVLRGELDMVEAALAAAERAIVPGLFLCRELIAQPHEDVLRALG
ncbi:MAG: BMC domain-containing protein [Myxococcales bacterium]|nr:BMC domain-containing protein [Myxococcota bacterium]MDW8280412.1 BMC domain-containing protein [Myxococcales bacterium]